MLNTDLTDLSDLEDDYLEAANKLLGLPDSAEKTRRAAKTFSWPRASIILARCIQAHYPEMIADPVTRKAREICEKNGVGGYFHVGFAKAAILAGMAMERDS